jgi:hypothetical protein
MGVGFVADSNGKAQVAHAHLVDAQLAVVALLLDVSGRDSAVSIAVGGGA